MISVCLKLFPFRSALHGSCPIAKSPWTGLILFSPLPTAGDCEVLTVEVLSNRLYNLADVG